MTGNEVRPGGSGCLLHLSAHVYTVQPDKGNLNFLLLNLATYSTLMTYFVFTKSAVPLFATGVEQVF